MFICCFKQKTAYEMRISDWSSDVCSSDLLAIPRLERARHVRLRTVAQDQGEAGDRVERPQDERQADDLPQFLGRAFLRRLRGRVEEGGRGGQGGCGGRRLRAEAERVVDPELGALDIVVKDGGAVADHGV